MTAAVRLQFIPGTSLFSPPELVRDTQARAMGIGALGKPGGLGSLSRLPGEGTIRRVVDLGAGVGAFSAWAALRWPYAWQTLYETDLELVALLRLNRAPGARILEEVPREIPRCDLLRFGPGALAALGGVCDLVMADFPALQIVVFDWEDERDAIDMGGALGELGLRMVDAGVHKVGAGWQVWAKLSEKAGA